MMTALLVVVQSHGALFLFLSEAITTLRNGR